MKRVAMLVVAMAVSCAMAQQVEISLPEPSSLRLDWQAIPGQTYRVMATTNLLDQPWQDVVPGGLVAGSVIGAYTEPLVTRAAFFRVQKEDTNPPEIESLIPVADAIAVQSNATVSITVTDETGIDTNTIVVTIAGWEDMTLASPYVSRTCRAWHVTCGVQVPAPGKGEAEGKRKGNCVAARRGGEEAQRESTGR